MNEKLCIYLSYCLWTTVLHIIILSTVIVTCMFCIVHRLHMYSMCSLAVSTQDSPAVEPRSNPGSGEILMSENLRLYTTSPVVMC